MTVTIYRELEQVCSVDGCDRAKRTRGWCSAHYTQWHRTGVIPTRPFTDAARFYTYVDKRGPDECWTWTGTVKKHGYGQFWFNGKPDRAHRVSYTLSNGEIPAGLLIRHACDNKLCVNPTHLLTGTVKDNAQDAVERDLRPRGERVGTAKLTAAQVSEIRERRERGETYMSLARRFGVSHGAIYWILIGRTWAGLGEQA